MLEDALGLDEELFRSAFRAQVFVTTAERSRSFKHTLPVSYMALGRSYKVRQYL